MGHKFLSHCFWCLIWFTLLHFHTKASPYPGTEPDLGVSALNIAMQSSPKTTGDTAAAPETLPCDQGERDSSVAEMTCFPTENDQTCSVEELARRFKLPSAPCANLLVNQAEGGNPHGVFQFVGTSRFDLESVPSYGWSSNPNSVMADDQVLMLQDHKLPMQRGPATEIPDVCLPALQQAMTEESAGNSDPSLLLLPTDMADQSMQVHECRPATIIDGDTRAFESELRKESKCPESGQPSRQHNAIPWTEILRSTIEGTKSAAQLDASLQVKDLGSVDKDISESGEFQAPAATSGGHVQELAARNGAGGGAFKKIDGSHLKNVLAKNSKGPGSGAPSRGHN